ncbi:hypothetical protein PMAYCL1PPCAC_21782, partial [Pristionchus mayeri]
DGNGDDDNGDDDNGDNSHNDDNNQPKLSEYACADLQNDQHSRPSSSRLGMSATDKLEYNQNAQEFRITDASSSLLDKSATSNLKPLYGALSSADVRVAVDGEASFHGQRVQGRAFDAPADLLYSEYTQH